MTIKDVKEKLKTSINPVAKVLHHGEGFKVLIIGFSNAMILKEHKTQIPSKLTVLEGSVLYKQADTIVKLNQYDEQVIPIDKIHSVEALADSLCLLTQGK